MRIKLIEKDNGNPPGKAFVADKVPGGGQVIAALNLAKVEDQRPVLDFFLLRLGDLFDDLLDGEGFAGAGRAENGQVEGNLVRRGDVNRERMVDGQEVLDLASVGQFGIADLHDGHSRFGGEFDPGVRGFVG